MPRNDAVVVDYTRLSLADVEAQLEEIVRDVRSAFGNMDGRQLNWKPDEAGWSIAQCLDHLLSANRLMLRSIDDGLNPAAPRTMWQRLPGLPALFGQALIRSQGPTVTRKYKAPSDAQPALSDIGTDVVQRFAEQHQQMATLVESLDERRAARAIMRSPFVRFIMYSVLDGWRIIVAHDWRHIEQARRVAAELAGSAQAQRQAR